MENWKNKDRKSIIDYISSRSGEVSVSDIIKDSGAERLRVYPILQELMLEHQITITATEEMGAPAKVRMNCERNG